MKRLFSLTFLAVLAVLVASPAQATLSRVNALAGLSLYVEDNTNVFFLPQTLVQWQNQAYFEMFEDSFNDDDRFVGGNFHLPRLNVEAAVYANMPTLTPSLLEAFGVYSHVDPGKHSTIIIAKNQWGFNLSYGADSWKDDNSAVDALNKESTSWFGVGGGYSIQASKFTSEIGLQLGFGSGSTEYNGTGATATPFDESSFDLDVVIRNWYTRGRQGRFNSVITFSSENTSAESKATGATNTENKLSGTGFGLGIGWEYPASNNVLVIAVLEPVDYVMLKFEEPSSGGVNRDETTVTNLVLPAIFLAVEAKVAGWLTGRVGAAQSWGSETTEYTDGDDAANNTKITRGMSAFAINLGVGVELGRNFWMDAVINEQIFYTGPDFVTGNSISGDLVSQLSIGGRW